MQDMRHLRRASTGLGRGKAVWSLALLSMMELILVVAAACGGAAAAPQGQLGPDATRPASMAEQVGQYFCYVETLTADRPSVYGYLAPRGCQPSGAFKRGERMVFRFQVLDVSTGKIMTPDDAVSMKVRLPFIGDMDADFKQRGEGSVPDAPWTWDYCWDVPLDYPLGTLDYSIVINSKDGRSGVWKPPALVDPSRGIDSRPQITDD